LIFGGKLGKEQYIELSGLNALKQKIHDTSFIHWGFMAVRVMAPLQVNVLNSA